MQIECYIVGNAFGVHQWGENNVSHIKYGIYVPTLTTEYVGGRAFGYSNSYGKISADKKTIYWYVVSDRASYQVNENGYTYYWIAIG